MRKLLLVVAFSFWGVLSYAQVYVKGYVKKDGTYVQPHYRSSPDNTKINNYSYPGNTNPFTGKTAPGNFPVTSDGLPILTTPYPENRRTYYNDSKGNRSMYTVIVEIYFGVTVLECYDEKDQKMGFIHRLDTGEAYLYDLNYKLVKIIK